MAEKDCARQANLDEFVPEAEIERLAKQIKWPLPNDSLRTLSKNLIAFGLGIAAFNPQPWREQTARLRDVAMRAQKAALALRELEAALDDGRWVHTRAQIVEAAGLSEIDFGALATAIEQLLLPAQAMDQIKPVPQNEVFSIVVQLAALAFKQAIGRKPSVTYSDAKGKYGGKFVKLVDFLWTKLVLCCSRYEIAIDSPQGPTGLGKAVQTALKRMDDL